MHLQQAQPHMSAAVKHVRGWITVLSILVAVCCLSQMLTYGFVRFTEVRFTDASKPTPYGERNLQVVAPAETTPLPPPTEATTAETLTGAPVAATGGVRAHAIEKGREVAPQRVASGADVAMSRINLFAGSAGTLGCIMLVIMTLLGTVIAGGGNIPGVEKAVTASTWALVLGLICLPWGSLFPHLRVPGVFASYHDLCAVADRLPGSVSPTAAFFQWMVMPLVATTLSMFVLGLFRVAVERGIIATAPSHFDTAIQREMSDIARRGIAPVAGRAVGVLNRAIGGGHAGNPHAVSPSAAPMVPIPPSVSAPERPVLRPLSGEAHVEQALEEAAAVASSLVRETQATASTVGQSVADGKYRRLI